MKEVKDSGRLAPCSPGKSQILKSCTFYLMFEWILGLSDDETDTFHDAVDEFPDYPEYTVYQDTEDDITK